MINLKIKVCQLNQEWYEETGGKKFIKLTVWKKDEQDRFGNDYSIRQSAPREVRERMKAEGKSIPFVGDGRMFNAIHTSRCIEVVIDRDAIDMQAIYKGQKYSFLDCSLTHVPEKERGEMEADYYCYQTPSKEQRNVGKRGKRIGVAFRREIPGQRSSTPEGDYVENLEKSPLPPTPPDVLMDEADEIPF